MTKRVKKLPETVTVLGKTFKVIYTPDMDKGEYGEMLLEIRTIRINTNRPKNTWKATLVHEIVHAILGISGLSGILEDNLEEGIVIALEHGFEDFVEFD